MSASSGEPVRLDAAQLIGVGVIAPGAVPPGPGLEYPALCALLSEHARVVFPEDGDRVIEPRPEGYALVALADAAGRRLTVVTTETGKARTLLAAWASGVAYGPDLAVTTDTTVALVDGWPVPVIANPDTSVP